MADIWIIPGGPAIQENKDGATWFVPGAAAVQEAEAVPPEEYVPRIIIF